MSTPRQYRGAIFTMCLQCLSASTPCWRRQFARKEMTCCANLGASTLDNLCSKNNVSFSSSGFSCCVCASTIRHYLAGYRLNLRALWHASTAGCNQNKIHCPPGRAFFSCMARMLFRFVTRFAICSFTHESTERDNLRTPRML